MKCFYIFWIPLLHKTNLSIICEELPENILKDIPDHKAVIIKAKIDKKNFNIKLSYREQTDKKNKELHFKNHSRNKEGILVYSVELPEKNRDFFCEELSKNMHNAIYHYFKGFFHKHIYHHRSEDSLLPAFHSENITDWNDFVTRQTFLKQLVDFYYLKFDGYLKLWENAFYKTREEITQNTNVIKNIKTLDNIIQVAHDVFGEMQYCEFLLKAFPKEIAKKDKESILKTAKGLHNLYKNILFWRDYYTSKISFLDGKSGKRWGIIGVWIGVASILLTLYLEIQSDDIREINKDYRIYQDSLFQILRNDLNSIRDSISIIPIIDAK